MICIKTAECIIEILSRSDRPTIPVFRHQGSLHKSDGFTPNGGAEYKGVAIFDQYVAITRGDGNRATVTMEGEYKVVCALLNGATFDYRE